MKELSDQQIFEQLLTLGEQTPGINGAVTAGIRRGSKLIVATTSIASGITIHAEHNAIGYLDQSGGAQPDDTLYTTLEPCSGRWDSNRGIASCVDIIRSSGIRRVVYAASDPNQTELTHRILHESGIELIQIPDTDIQERARRLFESKVNDYQL